MNKVTQRISEVESSWSWYLSVLLWISGCHRSVEMVPTKSSAWCEDEIHDTLSCMIAYFGYNQIGMNQEIDLSKDNDIFTYPSNLSCLG